MSNEMLAVYLIFGALVFSAVIGYFIDRWHSKRALRDNCPADPDSSSADRRNTL